LQLQTCQRGIKKPSFFVSHVTSASKHKKRDLAKFFAESPIMHQLIFSPPSQNCQNPVNLLCVTAM
jgi:hypothetical protein